MSLSWDEEGERREEEEKPNVDRTSTGETKSDDSLPELISNDTGVEDNGFVILNTLPSSEDNEKRKTKEEKRTDEDIARKNKKIYEEIEKEGRQDSDERISNRANP